MNSDLAKVVSVPSILQEKMEQIKKLEVDLTALLERLQLQPSDANKVPEVIRKKEQTDELEADFKEMLKRKQNLDAKEAGRREIWKSCLRCDKKSIPVDYDGTYCTECQDEIDGIMMECDVEHATWANHQLKLQPRQRSVK